MGGVWRCILLLDNHIEQKGSTAVGNDDALYRYRLGVFALAEELGNVQFDAATDIAMINLRDETLGTKTIANRRVGTTRQRPQQKSGSGGQKTPTKRHLRDDPYVGTSVRWL